MLKTIQYNSSDIEAYKLLTKICLKAGETEEILEILHTRLQADENGDLYYCLARVYKYIGDSEKYCDNLELALNNPYTLTFPKKIVKQEFEYIEEKLDRKEKIEPQTTVEEYSPENQNLEDESEKADLDESEENFDEYSEGDEESEEDEELSEEEDEDFSDEDSEEDEEPEDDEELSDEDEDFFDEDSEEDDSYDDEVDEEQDE